MTLGAFSATDRTDDAVMMASVHGAFFGVHLPAARIEGLIAAHVPRRHIADVSDVYATKWWDYRRLSPGHSFLLFAHTYYRKFRLAARQFRAERARHDKKALLGVNAIHYQVEEIWDRDQSHITGMWNAMLTCDALGMPYDQFCELANQVAFDTQWRRLPQPKQLYSDKLAAQVVDRWIALKSDRLFTARHQLYALENYAGLEIQDQYREWLLDELTSRSAPVPALANVVYRSPQIPESLAAAHFPAHALNRARLLAS